MRRLRDVRRCSHSYWARRRNWLCSRVLGIGIVSRYVFLSFINLLKSVSDIMTLGSRGSKYRDFELLSRDSIDYEE